MGEALTPKKIEKSRIWGSEHGESSTSGSSWPKEVGLVSYLEKVWWRFRNIVAPGGFCRFRDA